MAQYYKFFNSTLDDKREYFAQDFADYFGTVLSTGLIHANGSPAMQVSVESGTMNTVVSTGKAIMKGHLYENTTDHTLSHGLPEPDRDRIDRIVLRLDMRHSERNILLHVIEGNSSTNPQPPTLQRDEFIHEISLAQIRIKADSSTIRQEDLIDERLDEDLCGLVHSLISIPTSQFLEQWDLFFNAKRDEINSESEAILQQLADDLVRFNEDWDDWFSNQQTEGFVMANEKEQPHGIPTLDGNATVPIDQLPPMDYVKLSDRGIAGGVATLDSSADVPRNQLGNIPIRTTGFIFDETPLLVVGNSSGFSIRNSSTTRPESEEFSLQVHFDGLTRLTFTSNRMNTNVTGSFRVYKNTSQIASGGTPNTSGTQHAVNVNVSKGDIIKFELYDVIATGGAGGSVSIESIKFQTSLVTGV